MLNNLKQKIIGNINKGVENSPFLFISGNLELLNEKVYNFSLDILAEFNISKLNIYVLKDNSEQIKISQIKEFLQKLNSKNPYGLQIFIIENISRFTLQAGNSVLKQFEEPGKGNLIFLTNQSEAGVLDTILSRVQTINLAYKKVDTTNSFYLDMITEYINGTSNNLISYFFKNKLEKQEYIDFLNSLVLLAKNKKIILNNDLLDELGDDINSIVKNNVLPRGIIDKWILLIK